MHLFKYQLMLKKDNPRNQTILEKKLINENEIVL